MVPYFSSVFLRMANAHLQCAAQLTWLETCSIKNDSLTEFVSFPRVNCAISIIGLDAISKISLVGNGPFG